MSPLSLFRVWTTAAVLLVAATVSAQPAGSTEIDDETRNAARDLAIQGRDAFNAGEYEKALDLMHRAYVLVKAPTVAIYEARSLDKLGRLVEATEAYMRAIHTPIDESSPDQYERAIQESRAELAALKPRIPRLTIEVDGPGAENPGLRVTLDGKDVPRALIGVARPIDPGTHEASAATPAGEGAQETISLTERDRKNLVLTLVAGAAPVTAAPSPGDPADDGMRQDEGAPGKTQKILAYTSLGVGAAGLAIGLGTALKALDKLDVAKKGCSPPDGEGVRTCTEDTREQNAYDSFKTLRTVSTVGYVVGIVGVAAGMTLWITAPTEPTRDAQVGAYLGPSTAGLRGRF